MPIDRALANLRELPGFKMKSDAELRRVVLAVLEGVRNDVGPVNAMIPRLQGAIVEYVKRERAGSSASMNGALDYAEIDAWRAAIDHLIREAEGG